VNRRVGVLVAALAIAPVRAPLSGATVFQAQAQGREGAGALRVVTRLSADTVRVGEPFTVGVVATSGDSVQLPRLLETGDAWEQLEVGRIERGGDGEVRAYYRVVAWEAGQLELPSIDVATGGAAGRSYAVRLPAPWVRTVLPADAEDVKLRGPRPPIDDGFSWLPWLLLAALAVALWWWWRRQRAVDVVAEETRPAELAPRERALAALAALREDAAKDGLPAAAFYDRLEEILRRYLAEARDWPPTRPVRASAWPSPGAMRELQRHAVMARFAGAAAAEDRRRDDVDTSIAWLRKDEAA
jgi:hypothetical protein